MGRHHVYPLFGFVLLTLAFTWPLPAHLATHLTGPPSGDTGVYVWNIWVFRHELLENGRLPFLTSQILALDGPELKLGLHNYTTFANIIALPLIPLAGVVGAFNIVYLLNVFLSAYAMFLLARQETGRTAESWLAGALFAGSAPLIARGTEHFSLVAAAALPVFVLTLAYTARTRRLRHALALGIVVAWAAFSDPYYAVYCLLIALAFVAWRLFEIHLTERSALRQRTPVSWVLDTLIICLGGFIVGMVIRGGGRVELLGLQIRLETIYTPMLLLTVLLVARGLLWLRPRVTVRSNGLSFAGLKLLLASGLVAGLAVSPVLYAVAQQVGERQWVGPPVFWRSSAPGVDALAFLMPNPGHQWFGGPWRDWLATRPGGLVENVASIGFVALAVILFAAHARWHRVSRFWALFTLLFVSLSLGPFVVMAGVNTAIPTPWTLLRYVPVVSSARMPSRFTVLVMLGVAVLFAQALSALTRRYPGSRRPILVGVGLALLFELAPAPRPLFAASIPSFYRTIADDPRVVRVLELPFGIRDGLSSAGNFTAATQFHQTLHGKPIVGGYLSRISQRRVRAYRRTPVLDALITLSEGKPLTPVQLRRAYATRDKFFARAEIGYVVIDRRRTSPELSRFAIDLLRLRRLTAADGYELWVPSGADH